MQGLLIDHLVAHKDGENSYFSLNCTICGAVWKSAALPGLNRKTAVEEAAKHNHMCPFCGRPVCESCFQNVDRITLCAQCARRLQERMGE